MNCVPPQLARHATICGFGLASAVLTSCSTSPQQVWSNAGADYAEVRLADWKAPLQQDNGTLRVFLVHGMNNHPFGKVEEGPNKGQPNLGGCSTYGGLQKAMQGWYGKDREKWRNDRTNEAKENGWSKFVERIAKEYGHSLADEDTPLLTPLTKPDSEIVEGYLLTRHFRRNGNAPEMKFYIPNWALAVTGIKERQFGSWGILTGGKPPAEPYLDGEVSEMDPNLNKYRLPLNKTLKLSVVNWGLGDPSLYLGKAGPPIRRVVASGLRTMSSETTAHDRVIVVSASLGSTATLDCMSAFLRNKPPKDLDGWEWGPTGKTKNVKSLLETPAEQSGNQAPAKTAIYLFANQWALLNMSREGDPLKAMDNALPESSSTVQVYSFTDPNDLLSYPLNPKLEKMSVCNVYVRNPGRYLPKAGMDPAAAHGNYENNPAVIDAMFHGPKNVYVTKPE